MSLKALFFRIRMDADAASGDGEVRHFSCSRTSKASSYRFTDRQCTALYDSFSLVDAQDVVTIERTTVNHDLKALELY